MNINDRSKYIETDTCTRVLVVKPDGSRSESESELVLEHSMNIYINEELAVRLVCTPNDLAELVIGRLVSGGYISDIEEVETLSICEYGRDARVFLKNDAPYLSPAGTQEEPTCCTDNKVIMSPRPDGLSIKAVKKADFEDKWIFSLAAAFKEDSKIHRSTGGTHSCYLMKAGEILYSAEDIGRHNAMDKAIGFAALRGIDMQDCILFTTGRVPADMARKVIISGIPVLVSKSVPTTAAIELAKDHGLTLICRAWPDSFEIFS